MDNYFERWFTRSSRETGHVETGTQLIAAPVTLPVLALLVSVKCACGQLRALFSFLYAPGTRDDASKTASDGNLSVVLSPKAEHRYMHA